MRTATTRIPLNTFAIGFGLAGLAEVWSTAGRTLGFPGIVAQVLWLIAAIAWVWLIVAHLVRGAGSGSSLSAQLRHPAQGPIAALVPITGMLLAGDLLTLVPVAGVALLLLSTIAAAVFAAWLIGTWLQGALTLEALHGGYLLPTVAAGLVGADVAAAAGLPTMGWGLFGVGLFFWAVVTTLLLLRFAIRPALPDPLVPTMAILVAPPAVAGIAWFSLDGLRVDPVSSMLAGLGVLLLLVQLALLPRYRVLRFSLGFWSFTFPAAAVATDAALWARMLAAPGRQIVTIVLVTAATALIAAIAARSLKGLARRGPRTTAEAVLGAADADDAHPGASETGTARITAP
jgi:tellurite resistance protein